VRFAHLPNFAPIQYSLKPSDTKVRTFKLDIQAGQGDSRFAAG
jgi:hypothetical protein